MLGLAMYEYVYKFSNLMNLELYIRLAMMCCGNGDDGTHMSWTWYFSARVIITDLLNLKKISILVAMIAIIPVSRRGMFSCNG